MFCGGNDLLIILLLLCACGGGDRNGCGCSSGYGNRNGGDCCDIILWYILFSCLCGEKNNCCK